MRPVAFALAAALVLATAAVPHAATFVYVVNINSDDVLQFEIGADGTLIPRSVNY